MGDKAQDTTQALLDAAVEVAALAAALTDTTAGTPGEALASDPARAAVLRQIPDVEHLLEALWERRRMRGGHLQSVLAQAAGAASGSTRGWEDVGDDAMIAQGASSALMARVILDRVAPDFGVLRGGQPARALDVGTGIGAIAATLAEAVPGLEVTGIDIAERPLELARERMRDLPAEVAARIRLIQHDVTTLSDVSRYDVVWLPMPFLPDAIVDAALARASAALRPGGLLVLGTRPDVVEPRTAAATAWLAALSGGGTLATSAVEARVMALGYRETVRYPTVPGGPVIVAAPAR